jgi:hypothetical protein
MCEVFENVVVFLLEAGCGLHIVSKVDADLDQSFTVSRTRASGTMEELGQHPGGSSLVIPPVDEKTAIMIAGWALTAPYWVPCRAKGEEKGVVVRCAFDDYYDDQDYNDLVVVCTRVAPQTGVGPYSTELPQGLETVVRRVLKAS